MITLDTLKYTKKLTSAGVPQQQAEAQAEALAEITADQLATKHDLKELETTLTNKIDSKIDKLRHELITRLGSLMVTSIGIATAIIGILISMHH